MTRALLALAAACALACPLALAAPAAQAAGAASAVSAPDPSSPRTRGPLVASSADEQSTSGPRLRGDDGVGRPVVAAPQPLPPGPAAGSLIQTTFALLLVLGALFALAWFMKRFAPGQMPGAAGLRIVGALNLGGRERIVVVEVGEQWIVVGASPGRINALATLPRQEGVAPLTPQATPAGNFADWLKQTLDKRNAKQDPQ